MLLSDDVIRRLRRARDLLGDDALSVRDVARGVAISQFHFIRQFHAAFGVTPHQFRTAVRIDRARDLLSRGSSVTEACMAVGFSSVGSFSDLFARRVGATPSAYRRRVSALVSLSPDDPYSLRAGCLTLMAAAFRNFGEARGVGAA